ncbi:MAG TPA: protein-glutamate O-methyltransferase CheR [Bryobacteraceae bacterium]|nr:protein-glutamate O-methyltransferase CheR [Bryobacteraceae bacterium]
MPEALQDVARASSLSLPSDVYRRICDLMYQRFGIQLGPAKKHLVVARLADLLRRKGVRSFDEYYQHVVSDVSGQELSAMVDALTTNFTSFFREPEHFEYLAKQVLPGLNRRPKIRVWSAGCATGEEPHSLACCLLEAAGAIRPNIEILATDISTRALAAAQRGVYPADHFAELSGTWQKRFLLRGEGKWQGWYRFKPEVHELIRFGYLNLNEPFSNVGVFNVIFCRNVMIYFDQAARQRLVGRLLQQLEPGGYLFPGHAESLSGVEQSLQLVQPAIYRKKA